jgi:hypothetical protein
MIDQRTTRHESNRLIDDHYLPKTVDGVHDDLVLGGVADEPLAGERDVCFQACKGAKGNKRLRWKKIK